MKKRRFNMVMSEEEYEKIEKKAKDLGLTVSAYLRMKGLGSKEDKK